MDADLLRPSVRVALGLATMAAAVALALAVLLQPRESALHFATVGVFAWVVVLGGALSWPVGIHIGVAWKAGELARERMNAETEQHKLAAARFAYEIAQIGRGVVAPADTPDAVVIDNAPGYAAEWDEYLLLALKYGEAKGGIGWQAMREFCGKDYGTWRRCVGGPLALAKYINPIRQGVTTEFAPGWTFDRVRGRIEAGVGNITPPPYAPPPAYSAEVKQPPVQPVETPQKQAETAVAG